VISGISESLGTVRLGSHQEFVRQSKFPKESALLSKRSR